MESKDLTGLGVVGGKAVDAIRAAIGTWYEPTRTRRAAAAEADALIIATEAQITRDSLLHRAAQRLAHQEERRQKNIEAIADSALTQLPPTLPSTNPSSDWLIQYFEHCKDVGDVNMRKLWAGLLAGEFARPGSFSLRTLEAVRLMTAHDARMFQALASVLVRVDGSKVYQCLHDARLKPIYAELGLTLHAQQHLELIGVAHHAWTFKVEPGAQAVLSQSGRTFAVENPSATTVFWLTTALTATGIELLALCEVQPVSRYFETLRETLEREKLLFKELTDA